MGSPFIQLNHSSLTTGDLSSLDLFLGVKSKFFDSQPPLFLTDMHLKVRVRFMQAFFQEAYQHCDLGYPSIVILERPQTRQETTRDHPFILRERSRWIRRCQGCKGTIEPSIKQVIANKEWVTFKDKGEMWKKFTDGHYHCSESCVQENHPDFKLDDLQKTSEDLPQSSSAIGLRC